jgi:hypothetical protein
VHIYLTCFDFYEKTEVNVYLSMTVTISYM